jgi:hypothetical protein
MRDADCAGGYVCDPQVSMSIPVTGGPSGSVEQVLFPGGSCTPKRLTAYDGTAASCDPAEPVGAQGCGADGVCDAIASGSGGTVFVGCRKGCDPVAEKPGCPAGY